MTDYPNVEFKSHWIGEDVLSVFLYMPWEDQNLQDDLVAAMKVVVGNYTGNSVTAIKRNVTITTV